MADETPDKQSISSTDADRAYLVVLTALIAELKYSGAIDGGVLAESIERFATAIKNPDPGYKQLISHFINHARLGSDKVGDKK